MLAYPTYYLYYFNKPYGHSIFFLFLNVFGGMNLVYCALLLFGHSFFIHFHSIGLDIPHSPHPSGLIHFLSIVSFGPGRFGLGLEGPGR